jgi:hypothetical protein
MGKLIVFLTLNKHNNEHTNKDLLVIHANKNITFNIRIETFL